MAITDHESLSNFIKIEKIYQSIKKEHPNFKVIFGNEIYLCRNGLNASNFISGQDKYYHFILLAKDATGAQQLQKLSTRAWMRSYMARGMRRVPTYYQDLFDIIMADPGHLIGSSACLGGTLGTQLLKWRETGDDILYEKIQTWCQQMAQLFGSGNFYLELQPSENHEQTFVNKQLITLSQKLNIPYIITTDSHYLTREDAPIHEAYLNAQDGDREVRSFYATTYMMNTAELESHLDLTEEELETAYSNIHKIKDMCEDFSFARPLDIPSLYWKPANINSIRPIWFERIPTLKKFWESDFEGDKLLALHTVEKLEGNDPTLQGEKVWEAVEDNLDKTWESSLVNNTHWSAYFLNLQKYVDLAWEAGSLVGPSRGSCGGFILMYILGIIQINPLAETVQTYSFRFLNPKRVSWIDCDTDIEGCKRKAVLDKFREVYRQDRVTNVATFRTEKSKAAVLTAARGLGIDVDAAQYIASLIPADRGQCRSLDQCMYGDPENGFEPIKAFVTEMTEHYPELWQVAHKIENLVCGIGVHAGGVIFTDKSFTDVTALMRALDGTVITQYDLHDDEAAGLIKIDLLSIEALDKIHICLDLLCDYGYIERQPTLRETYEKTVGIYTLERDDPKMWEMVWNHEILSLFQMEKQSGIQGIALTKPKSVEDLAHLNSIIRLMAQEKGGEMPIDKYARFKNNIDLWYQEMEDYGLTQTEIDVLKPVLNDSYGICESQEGFMRLLQIPECGGFDLNFADRVRKSIAKKNAKEYEELTKEYFEECEKKQLSKKLCSYVWNVLVATSRGYSFNLSHTLAYSLVALQEMNLAYKYPTIFWNTACLISDAGGVESDTDRDNETENIEEIQENCYGTVIDFTETDMDNEDDDDDDDEEATPAAIKKKKKTKTTNYGRIASAIGKIKTSGVSVVPPSINSSTYTFSPDVENNAIRYGLSGITKVGEDIVKQIIAGRPYKSIDDFLERVKLNKPQMINLIKSGAFDEFGDRVELMHHYVNLISDTKKRVTLQNMKMLIDFGLIPEEYDLQRRVYNFNKYIKKLKLDDTYYGLDNIAFNFYNQHFDIDQLIGADTESGFKIKQIVWDKYYKGHMDIIRPWVQKHSEELLKMINNKLTEEVWNKYCLGSISKWEMDSVSFYSHEHELAHVNNEYYGFNNFFELPDVPEVERVIYIKGKPVPILKIHRICGTVLDRDKMKKTVTLLTTNGVVAVKIYGTVFANYDRQISERDATGKKHVIQKSMFSRGNKIAICGVRDGDNFRAKKYSKTPYHLCEQISAINEDGTVEFAQRLESEEK